ncbi:hypothetical protein HHO41_00805 [Bacillus sp. DNRA2]|uniref:DUF6056 family protein n=1 Tax=Bacillus sp. DNRA2 TaxID=2723053 RepID=UPI00145E6FAA|nr:DUF6056 family protein [Bacillus sp. DNRA2]NMD68807.1 hypothetical protein [Bacillus sp. DNRA2]
MLLKQKNWFVYSFIFVLLYLYQLIVTILPGDDTIFSEASDQYSLVEWLSQRYSQWSGRLFPDTMVYFFLDENVWLWHIMNPLMMLLLAFSIVRIIKKITTWQEIVITLLVLGYFAQSVLSSGFFWITGSFNYLWPIALGAFSMIPFTDKVFRKDHLTINWKLSIHLIAGILASIGNEQVALSVACFSVLALIVLIIKKQKTDLFFVFFTLMVIIGACIQLFAPGNQVRYEANTEFWFPGFDQLSLKDHFYLGTIWAFEKLFRDMKYILLLLSTIAILVQFSENKKSPSFITVLFALQYTLTIGLHIIGDKIAYLYDFIKIKNYSFAESLFTLWNMPLDFLVALLPYIYWTLYIMLLAYILFNINKNKNRYFVIIILVAVISTLVVMFFSPTIYGSGNRVLSVASVLLALLVVKTIIEHQFCNRLYTISILASFSLLNLAIMYIKWHFNGFNSFL